VLQGRIRNAIALGLLALLLFTARTLTSGPTASAATSAALISTGVSCYGDGAEVTFGWLPGSETGAQWVDISLFNNDFAEGSYIGAGPLQPNQGAFVWPGIRPGLRHFWRVTSVTSSGWAVSATGSFTPCASAAAPSQPLPPAAPITVSLTSLERELFEGQNQQRIAAGLQPLRLDEALVSAARRRAQDMATRHYFAHYSPSGESAFTLLEAGRIPYSLAGENIARNNYPDSQSSSIALSGFMASAGHRANMLERAYTNVGVGVATDGEMKYYAVVFVQP
jgi:uncharacterized protein YkwD